MRLIFVKFVKSLIAISGMVLGILCFVIAVQTNNLVFLKTRKHLQKIVFALECLYILSFGCI